MRRIFLFLRPEMDIISLTFSGNKIIYPRNMMLFVRKMVSDEQRGCQTNSDG